MKGSMSESTLLREASHKRPPTESSPENGRLMHHGVVITRGAYWTEPDGTHVFKSTEFDVMGEGDTMKKALHAFKCSVEDFLFHLGDLIRQEDATPHEVEAFVLLAERMIEGYHRCEKEREREPLIALNLPWRRRRQHSKSWQSALKKSSQPLHV
jgi:hypothetical protein